jgi:hypothetical protein
MPPMTGSAAITSLSRRFSRQPNRSSEAVESEVEESLPAERLGMARSIAIYHVVYRRECVSTSVTVHYDVAASPEASVSKLATKA